MPTTATAGQQYYVTTTGTRYGQRIATERVVTFVHAYAEDAEFIPADSTRPAQSRIFIKHPHGTVPMLIIKGSMRSVRSTDA